MNILLLSVGDNGGGCYWLADAINKYTKHKARSIRFIQSYLGYPYDIFAPSNEELARWVAWANVLHMRDSVNDKWPPGHASKPGVVTWTGMSYRQHTANKVAMCKRNNWLVTVSTPDLVSYYKDALWLPNPREEMAGDHNKEFTVCHAPTFRERKGTNSVIAACKKANVKLELIENVSYIEALGYKAHCSACVDQFAFGYGNNAIEAWAMGQPVISGALAAKFQQVTIDGFGRLPYVNCKEDVDAIVSALDTLRDDSKRKLWAEAGREYFFKFHHAPVVAKRAVEIYERIAK